MDEKGKTLGFSSNTAKIGIGQVILSRIMMAIPSMGIFGMNLSKL